mmetsp:Transcript_48576/g.136553  ORF Transcript_48576/g.136553 Transcript_48576/m.136553 type:complete len:449 (+) Transcript_48576:1191-2537(+)
MTIWGECHVRSRVLFLFVLCTHSHSDAYRDSLMSADKHGTIRDHDHYHDHGTWQDERLGGSSHDYAGSGRRRHLFANGSQNDERVERQLRGHTHTGHDRMQHRRLFANANTTAESASSSACMSKLGYPCAPVDVGCKRPSLVHMIRLRGCGNKMVLEGVLEHLIPRRSFIVNEGWSLAHPAVASNLNTVRAAGHDGLIVLLLRHPIERALSRYWFEGRWQLFHERTPGSELPFSTWLSREHCRPKERARSPRLWDCTENYYVKTFSNWTGAPQCDERGEGCIGGLDRRSLEAAKDMLLDLGFDQSERWSDADGKQGRSNRLLMLITEWLSEPSLISLAGRELCFKHVDGATPAFKPLEEPGGRRRQIPSFKPKKPGGGHSGERPLEWEPSPNEMERLVGANKWDLALYEWASGRLRRRLEREFPHLPLAPRVCESPPCEAAMPPGHVA